MSEYIEVGQPLQFTDPNTPTRVGEIVESVSDIYNIPSPRLGMQVFVKSEKKSFVITSLKSKVIGGVDVPEAAVEAFESVGATDITWNNDTNPSNMNDFVVAGVYDIKGEHTRVDDNLPVLNTGGGHTFNVRLTVLDSSIERTEGEPQSDDKCITQVLSFSNRLGQGEVYIRTGKGSSLDNLTWENWSTLQRNVNVVSVESLDDLIDNGIYSGVLNPTGETFVLVVINNYALAGKYGIERSISQFKYSVNPTGVVSFGKRVKKGDSAFTNTWDIINSENIYKAIGDSLTNAMNYTDKTIEKLVGKAPDTLDSLQEIAEWVETHEDLYEFLESVVELNSQAIEDEKTRAENAEKEINGKAAHYKTLHFTTQEDKVNFSGRSVDGHNIISQTIPVATITAAGVMSADDKKKLEKNTEDIATEVTRAKEAETSIIKNALQIDYTGLEIVNNELQFVKNALDNTQIIVDKIPAATIKKAGIMSMEDKVALDAVPSKIESAITEESKITDEKIAKEKTAIVNGDTIVGQAREIHSRNGKTVTDSFLIRTTAGSGTIGDGVASLKSVGGNIVKNVSVDRIVANNVVNCSVIQLSPYLWKLNILKETQAVYKCHISHIIPSHKYYIRYAIFSNVSARQGIALGGGYSNNRFSAITAAPIPTEQWCNVSAVLTYNPEDGFVDLGFNMLYPFSTTNMPAGTYCYITTPLFVNLTEMFGNGNEPDQAACDKLFGTMDALPQGLSIANPTEFKSTGYNQADPSKVLANKGIENGAIVDKVGSNIAVVPCLPCKIGTGENNGYCIHGAFDEGAESVYLTPLNPLEVDGELYLCKLTKDANKGTYVPQIKGYLLIEVPNATDLCVHFLWSEDCDRNAYEPYYESNIELPTIPEMSEWGLGALPTLTGIRDTIDLERGVYIKRVVKYTIPKAAFIGYKAANETYPFGYFYFQTSPESKIKFTNVRSIITDRYATGTNFKTDKTVFTNTSGAGNTVYVVDSGYSDVESLRESLKDTVFYAECVPIEYPLPKVDNNYISSDYGVEMFDSVVPCSANNLYYMRSLAGETRNFLDRLMAGLGTSDATVVADRILAVVNPAVEPANVEPETPIEE